MLKIKFRQFKYATQHPCLNLYIGLGFLHAMNRKILAVIIILVGGCISQVYTEEEAKEIAKDFIENSPTFRFDGMNRTLKVTDVEVLDCEGCFMVAVTFDCSYPGFGDRSGLFLVSRPTSHVARVQVEKGEITLAIIDDIWDEITQTSLS